MESIKSTEPKARKEYICDWCGLIIKKGEKHQNETLKLDGGLYSWRNHIRCKEIADELRLFDDCNDGLCSGDFREGVQSEYLEIKGESEDIPDFETQLNIVCEKHLNKQTNQNEMKKVVVVDIDGTISKVGDRLKYLQQTPKDWDKFYNACGEDEPIREICELVKMLSVSYKIIFCTGRRESSRLITMRWMRDNIDRLFLDAPLIMRPDGDYRHDTVVKPEMLQIAGIKLDEIAFVLEDRNSMVAKWRELGVKCLQVADGDF